MKGLKGQKKIPVHARAHDEWLTEQALYAPQAQYLQRLPAQGTLLPGQEQIFVARGANTLLWVPAAVKHQVHTEGGLFGEYSESRLYFIPTGTLLHLVASEEPVRFLSVEFVAHPALCMGRCPSDDTLPGKMTGDYRHRPRRGPAHITDLPISQGIHLWIASVEKLLGHGDVGIHMYDYKLQEFFLLLRLDYTRALIDEFLRHYHCRVSGFRKRVISHYTKDMDVADLYALGTELQLNEVAFKRSFIEEFAMSPRSWVTLQRSRYIYHDLITTERSVGEIGEEYGFCSMSYFSLFCKTNLGGTPMQIRKHRRRLNGFTD